MSPGPAATATRRARVARTGAPFRAAPALPRRARRVLGLLALALALTAALALVPPGPAHAQTAKGVEINKSTLSVPEGGDATYTVKLTAAPTHAVTIQVSRSSGDTDLTADTDDGTAGNQSTLTFSTTNWSTAQTVTVSAAEDADSTRGRATFAHAASSTDSDYSGITIAIVTATESDNDVLSPPTLGTAVLSRVTYGSSHTPPAGSAAWRETFGFTSGTRLTGAIVTGAVTCDAGSTAEIGWYGSDAPTARLGSYGQLLPYTPAATGEYRALAYCYRAYSASGCAAASELASAAFATTPPSETLPAPWPV